MIIHEANKSNNTLLFDNSLDWNYNIYVFNHFCSDGRIVDSKIKYNIEK